MPSNEAFLMHVPEPWRGDALRMARDLRALDRVIVAAHVSPDGDAAGSMALMGHLLRSWGREFVLLLPDGIPGHLSFLPMPGPVCADPADAPFAPRTALILDCNEPHRVGGRLERLLPDLAAIACIDHHLGGTLEAHPSWQEPAAAATAQLAAYVLLAAGLPLVGEIAEAAALGLVTDTGGFVHGSTSGDVFRLAALLHDNGCDIPALRSRLDNGWSLGRMRLWGRCASECRLFRNGSIAAHAVTRDDMRALGAGKDDMEGLADLLRRLEGVRMAMILRETDDGAFKFSLRSAGSTDVRAVALAFGGGGHRNAAGGALHMPREEAEAALIAAATAELDAEDAAAGRAESGA